MIRVVRYNKSPNFRGAFWLLDKQEYNKITMNKEPNIFPEINLFPRIKAVGEWIANHLSFLPNQPLASHGDHFNSGAAPNQMTFDYPDKKPDAGL